MKEIRPFIRRLRTSGRLAELPCAHIDQINEVSPSGDGCKECLEMGSRWVHLRVCLTCGHVGCCDNSINRHATAHYHETGHSVILSFEPGESWMWCYADAEFMEPSLNG